MRTFVAICCILVASSASAQQGIGIGTGTATSRSQSGAVAIGGGAATATGGNATSAGGSATIAGGAVTLNQNQPATQTIKNVPTEFAPGLAAAGLETCLGSISGGGAFVGTGFSFGTTIPDPGCAARLDARTLWSFGLKKAAVARLCLQPEIWKSMPDVCSVYEVAAPTGWVWPSGTPQQLAAIGPVGPVEVRIRRTGEVRLCDDYDVSRERCRVWARKSAATSRRLE